jgi:hypothetical protein
MKLNSTFLVVGLLVAGVVPIKSIAQVAPVSELEIGPTGFNQVTGTNMYSGAIGQQNVVSGMRSFSVGQLNDVEGQNSFALGYDNTVQGHGSLAAGTGNMSSTYNPSFAFGSGNYVLGEYSLAVGCFNNINRSEYGAAYTSGALGSYNTIGDFTASSFAFGMNNIIDGYYNESTSSGVLTEAAAVLGCGLINYWSHSTIVGRYNDTTVPIDPQAPLLFAVGKGTSTYQRSNAMEVYGNSLVKFKGTVTMPRQGDVPMGEFGNP